MKSKEEYWDRLFKGYEGSGLSQEEFCSEQGIPMYTFGQIRVELHGIVN